MKRKTLTILFLGLSASLMWAQDEPAADPTSTSSQTIVNIGGKVFGGARQADIGGSAIVNIGAEKHDVIINAVYGGNDISGTIGHLTEDYDAVVNTTDDGKHLFIGQLFGGGYGNYSYTYKTIDDKGKVTYTVEYQEKLWDEDTQSFKLEDKTLSGIVKPEVDSVSISIQGGTIAYVYGGGDNVTVKKKTNISINNESGVVVSSDFPEGMLGQTRLEAMGILTVSGVIDRDTYHFSRVFGGNNKAEMPIMPTWDLQKGKIENLYSGGNEGAMTSSTGILLEINPSPNGTDADKEKLEIFNVYGGCRKADVHPKDENGATVTVTNAALNAYFGYTNPDTYIYKFPDELSARLLVRGGKITNVYGGNDITGRVYGGNAVGVYTSVLGDIYGGGNGSYPYTDKDEYKTNLKYKDYYYEVPTGKTPVEALNDFRPNAEQVSLRVAGYPVTQQNGEKLDTVGIKPTIIHGGIYVGGNSATLKNTTKDNPRAELKIGSYVLADNIFLGNNGANMVTNNDEEKDNQNNITKEKGILQVMKDVNSMDLTNEDVFAEYMEGCAMDLMPSVVFDNMGSGDPATYEDYSTYIGSIFCGGNVGSMTKAGTTTMDFKRKIVVFDKVVGGCNNAYVPAKEDVNAAYNGGIIGAPVERAANGYLDGSNIKNRLIMNFSGLKLQPKRWKELAANESPISEVAIYPKQLEWNTIDGNGNPTPAIENFTADEISNLKDLKDDDNNVVKDDNGDPIKYLESSDDDLNRRFKEGHIYGGCYNSGVVNGNVVINLNNSIVDRDLLFDEVLEDTLGEALLYGHDDGYKIRKRHTGVILGQQGMDVLGAALNVFGGGKGPGTEIWGSTTINLNAGYTFQIFGGSEQGVIGRPKTVSTTKGGSSSDYTFSYKIDDGTTEGITITKTYEYDPRYSCYVNLAGANAGVSKRENSKESMAECEFMYGGGFEGPICGNTVINLGKGRIFNSFAGSCNADILGHTETYIGRQVKEGTTTATQYEYKNNFGKYIASESTYEEGFPWVRDIVYGGNDLGGRIMEKTPQNFKSRVRKSGNGDTFNVLSKVHNPNNSDDPEVLTAAAYVEYLQGRADAIFGGCYGTYNLKETCFSKYTYPNGWAKAGFYKPFLNNAFVNFRPTYTNTNNVVKKVYGAGQGYTGEAARDSMQNRSYVLIDIPDAFGEKYKALEVFGAGAWGGIGMGVDPTELVDHQEGNNTVKGQPDKASAIIDLMRGTIGAAYGASYKEGVTRRTVVNVPSGSTIKIGSIFGGAYGTEPLLPCDVYEANVEYHSANACLIYDPERTEKETNPDTGEETTKKLGDLKMKGAIYGGNNQERRTIYGRINIDVPVKQDSYKYGMTTATIYGAGYGPSTWSEYTEIDLKNGASVWEVYGGGEAGRVINAESVQKYMNDYRSVQGATEEQWAAAWKLGGGLDPNSPTGYVSNAKTNLSNPLARTAEIDDRETKTYKYNTNVIIHKGAYVGNYAYGGGLGKEGTDMAGSGDVYGTTYIALLGGEVSKDIYAAGTLGAVYDAFGAKNYTASTTAYIGGGTVRNVYGGGWKGDVGSTKMTISEDEKTATFDPNKEIPGETHVVIGIRQDQAETSLVNELKKVIGNNATKNDYGIYGGLPAIQRNAYSGGEGGAVFGKANLTLNNGYIGYGYSTDSLEASAKYGIPGGYYPMIEDKTYKVNGVFVPNKRLADCGNMFGGGYDVRSSVDETSVKIWNGVIRNSVHGGGEIATIGRGAVTPSGTNNSVRTLKGFYKAGKTHVEMYNGHVLRNVFGGGKGYNIYGYGQEGTLYTDGYVFGQTEVHIHGGEIGTEEGLADGYGNVFGGGDIGYVFSPSITSDKTKQKESTHSPGHIYYYNDEGNLEEDCKVVIAPWLQVRNENGATINGKTKAQYDYFETADLNTLPKTKEKGNWTGEWANLFTGDYLNGNVNPDDPDERGIHIHNAVFGGGNVSSNSDQSYANATTVFGNTTATLFDIYHRDFITVGTEHTGGIYGGGNLSVVDGYRELNITNYGTDYYGLQQTISIDEYRGLSNRERAYFQLEYECIAESETNSEGKKGVWINDVFYEKGKKLSEEDYLKLANSENAEISAKAKSSFNPYGFCSIYAGRLLNTIQRADLCGVFGSRMVLQGAKDRVAEVGEDIDYTINRVGELSLNQQHSVISSDTGDDALHGNYFGIYSLVNYLGNMTSDVHFSDDIIDGNGHNVYFDADNNVVKTVKIGGVDVDVNTLSEEELTAQGLTKTTYYGYKSAKHTNSDRNKGKSFNQVALASGVFLELTTEETELDPDREKVYGLVTGVIELDLINVKRDLVGGGFVYARNEHRVPRRYPNKENAILSEYNKISRNEACTYKQFRYSPSTTDGEIWDDNDPDIYTVGWPETDHAVHDFGETREWQTSGNFIHHEKRIVDDCYPTNNAYIMGSPNYSKAHYWYVKGDVYIYEQKVSAYTGSANAYSKEVILPLTITAASHGQLQLLNVKPNLYAYYTDNNGERVKIGSLGSDNKPIDKVTVNNESDTYKLNDVISWWDWHQMTASDRQYFVANTYVNCVPCKVDDVPYEAGTYVMDDKDFKTFQEETHVICDNSGELFKDDDGNDIGLSYVFRSSNNISHETGYVLTFDMNSPKIWDDYYTKVNGTEKISKEEYEALLNAAADDAARQAVINAWREGPTFTPTTSAVYGKREYKEGDVITKAAYDNAGEGKDKMERAYVATATVTYTYKGIQKTMNPGASISATEFGEIGSAQSSFDEALICTNTVKLSKDEYMLYGELKTAAQITDIKAAIDADDTRSAADKTKLKNEIDAALTDAYILTASGTYGGQQFNTGTNYGAIEAWCSLTSADRDNFNYNFDALDLLANSDYLKVNTSVTSSPEHSTTVEAFHTPYTDEVKVEYQAVYVDDTPRDIYYENSTTPKSFTKGTEGATITNTEYETIRNDKKHYTHIETTKVNETVYITNKNFVYLGVPYGVGQVVDKGVFDNNSGSVDDITFATPVNCYYCYEQYTDKNGTTIEKGTQHTSNDYKSEDIVPNYQQYFIIQGKEPTETTTLYVSRESNAYDVMKEKIITVVYQYTYNEDEDDGGVKKTNELHVINIHLQLESGAPVIGLLQDPPTVLPGNAVGLSRPDVNPGLYEVLNSGWELFTTLDDANNHRNGTPFVNNSTPVYWYQNQKNWVAFYSRTWLGKTYSNSVPLSVANYHDLDAIMKDKEHHMYVDRSDVDRDCKIYIDNRECQSDASKSELDLLKDFFDLTVHSTTEGVTDGVVTETGALEGHSLLGNYIQAGSNLEFHLRSNVSPKAYAANTVGWTPIGDANNCFAGNLHGDGYTISGLKPNPSASTDAGKTGSLFGQLCGKVYNLGVKGSFTGSGVADGGAGRVENCWVSTTGNTGSSKAVFGGTGPLVNSYYVNTQYSNANSGATGMPVHSFYNGEVAYNLNGFYLNKRFYDNNSAWTGDKKPYYFLDVTNDGTLPTTMSDGKYPDTYAIYQPQLTPDQGETLPYLGYVENRFYDGDYRYAGGTIPEGTDMRSRTVKVMVGTGDDAKLVDKTFYPPIWPDDYLFFGQALNYSHMDGIDGRDLRTHQDMPSRIQKTSDRITTTTDGNRVYRAPAYFQSSEMGVAYFNPHAVFAQTKKGAPSIVAYKGMTAIDFTGHGESGYQSGSVTTAPYNHDNLIPGGAFFPPLLDDGGIQSIYFADLTRNILAYTGTSTLAAAQTNTTVDNYLTDEACVETDSKYRTVAEWDSNSDNVHGHKVQLTNEGYQAQRDHLLVDKQDFNCPISYTFATGKRMWYQRVPERYVSLTTGWDVVSLPFTAELVTTQDKGEITHFYDKSKTVDDDTKIGHEYWLREYGGEKSKTSEVFTAIFNYPTHKDSDLDKEVENTYLWDHYYSQNSQLDANSDTYQTLYESSRDLEKYAMLTNGVPYIIGFPGKTYYEFDLSGEWNNPHYPMNTATPQPETPGKQTITFASYPSNSDGFPVLTIGVSDEEYRAAAEKNGYTFVPNYMSKEVANCYLMNDEGNQFGKVTSTAPVPFRPYFIAGSVSSPAMTRGLVDTIVFDDDNSSFAIGDEDPSEGIGGLTFSVGKHKIIVSSTLRTTADVGIYTVSGLCIGSFDIQPGETIETPVYTSGVYIIRAAGGHYTKKVTIK